MAFGMLAIGLQEPKEEISAPIMAGAVVILCIWIAAQDIHTKYNKLKNNSNDKTPNQPAP